MPENEWIHVVDDDAAVRDSLQVLLETSGYSVRTYSSGSALLDDPPQSGCVLLDVRMPDLDGIAVLERLRAQGVSVPVIMITGHGDVSLAVRAMKAGAVDFIEKPFDQNAILESIRTALASAAPAPVTKPEAVERLGQLTPREREVLHGLIAGLPNKAIALELGISPRTVEIHRARVMEKTGARNLPELVRLGIAAGIEPVISSADGNSKRSVSQRQ